MSAGTLQKSGQSARAPGDAAGIRLFPGSSRIVLAVLCLLVLIEASFVCFLPLGVRHFIDTLLKIRDRAALELLFTAIGGALAGALGIGLFRDFLFAGLRSRSLASLRQTMFGSLQSLAIQSHIEHQRHPILEGFSDEIAAAERAFAPAISRGLFPLAVSLLATGLMLWLDWHIGMAAVILWPWVVLAPKLATPLRNSAGSESQHHEAGVMSVVQENLSAQAVIRAFAIEHLGAAAFRARNEALSRSMMRAGLWGAFMERFTGAGVLFEQVFALGLSAWLVFAGAMSVGTMAALQMLAAVVGASLLTLVDYLPEFVRGCDAIGEIKRRLGTAGSVADAPNARVLPPFSSEIVFSGVGFHTSEGAANHGGLSNVNLRIPKGSYAACVGPSGAGKSAILHLLMRFHDPASGRVTIDGHDVRQVTQASLRAQMGAVLQEGFVFNSSIRENIRMGCPAASEEAVREAARSAGMLEFIQAQPKSFETLVGSDGLQLSGEMAQRLALARALLRGPSIVLLDEIASALDPAEEAALNATIGNLAKSTTLISMTHRLASVAGASHIFVFDSGRVVEQGSHFELMARGGVYADLWRKQAGFRFSADGRHVDVDVQRLKSLPILENLPEAILAELAPYFATETFAAGRDIVCQNDPGDKFYIIARGQVEVWRTEEQSGRSLCVNVLSDGDFFGEITLITGFPRSATIRAVAVTTCLSLERGRFTKLIDRFPELKQQLSEIAVNRLRDSSKQAAVARP